MKAFLRWLGKTVGSAVTIVLVFVIFPYVSKWAARLMPDESGAAIKASAIIASKIEESARLETLRVEEEGVLNYDIQAAFIGSVANINVRYAYSASFGVDLSQVEMQVSSSEITFLLPAPEVIQDSLTPLETYRDDFWYPGFSDADYAKLLEDERVTRREVYLTGENAAQLRETTLAVFEKTIAAWMKDVNANLVIHYEMADAAAAN